MYPLILNILYVTSHAYMHEETSDFYDIHDSNDPFNAQNKLGKLC